MLKLDFYTIRPKGVPLTTAFKDDSMRIFCLLLFIMLMSVTVPIYAQNSDNCISELDNVLDPQGNPSIEGLETFSKCQMLLRPRGDKGLNQLLTSAMWYAIENDQDHKAIKLVQLNLGTIRSQDGQEVMKLYEMYGLENQLLRLFLRVHQPCQALKVIQDRDPLIFPALVRSEMKVAQKSCLLNDKKTAYKHMLNAASILNLMRPTIKNIFGPQMASKKDLHPQTKCRDDQTKPTTLKNTPLIFPYEAQYLGQEGFVLIETSISKTGKAEDPKIIESDNEVLFGESALNSISQWTFCPATKNGLPIKSERLKYLLKFKFEGRNGPESGIRITSHF